MVRLNRQLVRRGGGRGDGRELVKFAERFSERKLPESGRLAEDANHVESLLQKLSSRWQSAEDLEVRTQRVLGDAVHKMTR